MSQLTAVASLHNTHFVDIPLDTDTEGAVKRILPEMTGIFIKSEQLYNKIAGFIDDHGTCSLTKEKIQDVFADFTQQIINLKAEEEHNAILISAEGLIASSQTWIHQNGHFTILRKTPSLTHLSENLKPSSASSSSSSSFGSSFPTISSIKDSVTNMLSSIATNTSSYSGSASAALSSYASNLTGYLSVIPVTFSFPFLSSAPSSQSSLSHLYSSFASLMDSDEETILPSDLTDEEILYREIIAFFEKPEIYSTPAEKMEEHFKAFDERLKKVEASTRNPSKRIQAFLDERRQSINIRSTGITTPSGSFSRSSPSLLTTASELQEIGQDIANKKIPLLEASKRLAKYTTELPLQIDQEQIMMPITGHVLYHLTMMHWDKSPSSKIMELEYGIKAFENRDGCSATNPERCRALNLTRKTVLQHCSTK
jgi:hypothetical protein